MDETVLKALQVVGSAIVGFIGGAFASGWKAGGVYERTMTKLKAVEDKQIDLECSLESRIKSAIIEHQLHSQGAIAEIQKDMAVLTTHSKNLARQLECLRASIETLADRRHINTGHDPERRRNE